VNQEGPVSVPRGCGFSVSLAVFAAMGLVDWLILLVDAGELSAGVALSLPVCLGTWVLAGFTAAAIQWCIAALLFGPGRGTAALERFGAWLWAALSERATPSDRRRVAALWSVLSWTVLFSCASILWTAYLVANRHGAVLIAVTATVGNLALAALTAIPARSLYKLAVAALEQVRPGTLAAEVTSFASSVLLLVGLGAVGAVALVALFRSTIVAVDGISLVLPAGAVVLQVPAYYLLRRRVSDRWFLVLVAPAALALAWTGALEGQTRLALATHSTTEKYLFSGLQELSDFDGDGVPLFPGLDDCDPFDPGVHPFAAEIEGNGIDENCDGDDFLPDYAPRLAPPRKKLTTRARKPDILLITVDATRVDHLGFFGYDRETSPNIDWLAERSRVFSQAFSQDSGTGPSGWSLMAGKTPFQVQLVDAHRFPPNYAESEVLLAEVLKKGGYTTSAVTCAAMLGKKSWNIRRGFDRFDMPCGRRDSKVAPVVLKKALDEVKKLRRSSKPFFLWVHFLDPHHPYTSHEDPAFGDRPVDDYDEEIRYTDDHIGKLLNVAMRPSKSRSLYTVLYADHGENFNEHGKDPHARTLYREVTHVPLMVSGPDVVKGTTDTPVAVGDIYPTVIELAGLKVPESTTMFSLLPMVLGEEGDPDRLVFQENSWSRPTRHVKGVVKGRYHMLMDTTNNVVELYDMEEDPGEKNDLYGTGLPEETDMKRALLWFIQTTSIPPEIR